MPGYLDAAAGAPMHPVARQALQAAWDDGWADPARLYGAGRRAGLLLEAARESLADSIGARPDEISFTANATTALHAAVLGTLIAHQRRAIDFVHSAVEHSAVLHAATAHAQRSGASVTSVAVDRFGRVELGTFVAEARKPPVAAAALQAANHEVGTVQPVTEAAALIHPVPLIVDLSQTLGHLPTPDGWAACAADARAWGGPTMGVLGVRTGVRWRSPWPVDERESGRVPGVPSVPAAVAGAAALRAVLADRDVQAARLHALIARIRTAVASRIDDVDVVGDPDARLPHIVTFSFLYADGEALLRELDRRGFAVSSGSSCTSSTLEPSHVLVAMGALTSGNIRVSLHPGTTEAEVDEFLAALPDVVADVRAELGASGR